MTIEQASAAYQAYRARYEALSEKDKAYFDQLGAAGRNYTTRCDEAMKIAKLYNNSLLDGFCAVFALGFLKGQRAVRK